MARAATATTRSHLRLVSSQAKVRRRATNARLITWLLVSVAGLVGMGLVMVLSASAVTSFAASGSSFSVFQRQAIYAGVGLAALVVAARMPYRVWRKMAGPFVLITLGLLALVLHPAFGQSAWGAARWIELGPVTIQPSELAKLAMIAFAAGMLTKKWGKLDDLGQLLIPLAPVLGIVCVLIMLQPDLGTTLVIAGSVFILLFVAGVRLRVLAAGGLAGLVIGMGLILSAPYRRARFLSFLNPWEDPRGDGYQLIQSLIALGSGGWTGVGLGASRQKWMYLPNAHTDFIFSIIGEELGLAGACAVLAFFVLLIFVAIQIAMRAPDTFGRLLAAGIACWFGLQAVVNLGAVTGVLPITGVPLPFLSAGGSSLVVSLVAVGILISVARAGPKGAGRSRAR